MTGAETGKWNQKKAAPDAAKWNQRDGTLLRRFGSGVFHRGGKDGVNVRPCLLYVIGKILPRSLFQGPQQRIAHGLIVFVPDTISQVADSEILSRRDQRVLPTRSLDPSPEMIGSEETLNP